MKPFGNSDYIGCKRFLAILFFTVMLFTPVLIVAQDLYHLEINSKSKDDKDLVMVLDEIVRHDKFSIIKVHRTSGASVSSVMVIVRGCYEIAKIRNEKYFTNLKEWNDEQGNRIYKIGFTSNKNNNPEVFFGDDIDRTKDLGYMSVKQFRSIFEPKQKSKKK